MSRSDSIVHRRPDRATTFRLSVAGLARDGAVASVIKLSSAGLSFLMFAVIAMVTDGRQFGLYSATYAGASLVSFFATIGQQSTVLRFWPQYAGTGDLRSAHGLMARAILLTFAGLAVSSLLIAVGGVVPGLGKGTPEWLSLCLAAALLSFALGWSEFASGAFRAKNALVSGLLPRDVVWRGATIVVVLAVHWVDAKLSALTVTLLSAGILIVVTLPQAFVLLRDTIAAARGPLSPAQKEEFRSVTLGLWGVTALPPALGQMSTLIVAAILGPEAAGAIFVAERATRLVSLALSGINQALAPQISSAFYSGDKPYVQQITSLTALGSLAMALGVSAVFAVFGNFILSIFDPSYATPTMWAVLIVFSLGATISTACGPIEVLLQLTGMQHALLKLLIVVNIVGLGVTALAAYWHGPLGAAASMALTLVIWNVIAVTIASRAIGINPSVVGLVARAGGAKAGSAEASGT